MSLTLPRGTAAAARRNLTPPSEDSLIAAARQPLFEFARHIGVPLAQHQADSLGLARRITAIVAPRQAGKSRGVAVLALHRALEIAGLHVLIVSAGEKAAARLLASIRRMALDADPSGARLAREPTNELIEFTNGSWIRCVPESERRIRGWTIDLLIIDEAGLVDDSIILDAAFPTTAARANARIVLVSSARLAVGAFYRFVTEGEAGAEDVASARWTLEQSPWIASEMVETARRAMPPAKFAAEYLGIFPESGAGLLIPRSWIRAAQERELPGREKGAFGVDVARSGTDFTTIYRNRGGVVRELARVHGQRTMDTANQVAHLLRKTPAAPAVVDVVGIGAGVVDRLAELGLMVVPFNAGARAHRHDQFANRRAEVFWNLRLAFEQERIDLDPQDQELADELAGLRYDTDSKGRTVMEGKDSMRARGVPSPDRADAIVMAISAAPMPLYEIGELGARKQPPQRQPTRDDRARARPGEARALRDRKW